MPDVIEAHALAAAILAGGRARRLGGANKAALEIGGLRMLDRQLAVLRDVASTVFLVGGDPAQAPPGLRVVPDAVAGAGALGGIYTAIVESPCDRTIVVGCDMPFLSAALFRRMAEEDADLVIPRSVRGYEPLCAIYGRGCAAPIRARIDKGLLHAAVLPDGVQVRELGPEALAAYDPDGLLFVNVNTPHDYERAKAMMEWKPNSTEDRITTDQDA